jgi:hypothetical protein
LQCGGWIDNRRARVGKSEHWVMGAGIYRKIAAQRGTGSRAARVEAVTNGLNRRSSDAGDLAGTVLHRPIRRGGSVFARWLNSQERPLGAVAGRGDPNC